MCLQAMQTPPAACAHDACLHYSCKACILTAAQQIATGAYSRSRATLAATAGTIGHMHTPASSHRHASACRCRPGIGASSKVPGSQSAPIETLRAPVAGSLAATHAQVWLDLQQLFLGSSGAAAQLLRLAEPLVAAFQPPQQVPPAAFWASGWRSHMLITACLIAVCHNSVQGTL